MVDAVVSFVVERLGDLLIEQVVSLRGVEDDVVWLRDKLESLKCFLKDAEEKQDVDNRMRQWISNLRDVAHEAEDIIDEFIVFQVEVEREAMTRKGWLELFGSPFKKAKLNQEANLGIGRKIKTLKMKLDQIQQNQVDFQIRPIDDAREGSDRMNMMEWLRKERPYKDNEHVVGFKEDANTLMSKLVKEVKDRYVISIVGTGGLGKTTIARKLYNTRSTKKFDCYGWVSVSKDYKIPDLLRSTIKSFRSHTKEEIEFLEKMKEDDLKSHLRDYLKGHQYLVVLDDVWDVNAWPSLMRAFPNENNGSRVILTTRIKAVAESSDERTYVYELPFLKDEESWELFCSKAFPNYDDEVGNRKNCCPPHLEILAREMVSKCRGLPLAIVVLGGLLRRKGEEPNEWRRLNEHMWRHVRDHDSNRVQHILALSFNDLPFHLKSCFLYMGLFPEDFEIVAEKLCRLWEAEGFIKLNGESFEEVAEECLRELIDRSLIQVAERNWKRILTYRVHDLLRDFAIQKSKELNFLHIFEDTLAPNIRRLASYCAFQRFALLDHSDMRLRTLLFFSEGDKNMEIAQLQSLFRKLRLLRVLDVHHRPSHVDQQMEQRLPDEIGKLIHLRYLGLCSTNRQVLSQFIGNLHALQTLDLSTSQIDEPIQLPDEVCKAKQLRHLIGNFKWPFQVDNFKNLRTLRTVFVDDEMEFNPVDLINLRELHIRYVGEGNITLGSIGGLTNLQSLQVEVFNNTGNPEVHLHQLSHCKNLVQLKLRTFYPRVSSAAVWKLPTEVLPNLMYLSLNGGRFTEDPMPMLEKLPKLTVLAICFCNLPELVCSSAGGFPLLQILRFDCLAMFQVEEGAMPVLKALSIGCRTAISRRLYHRSSARAALYQFRRVGLLRGGVLRFWILSFLFCK